jgi:hypothetical protein
VTAATLVAAEMPGWAPGTRHYVTAGGQHLAVQVDEGMTALSEAALDESLQALGFPALESGVHRIVIQPTTILPCTEDGQAITLDPLYTFPPGTSHEDALAQIEEG